MNVTAGRHILVTGASTGIGRASVLALLSAGFGVFAAVRDEQAAAALRQEAPPGTAGRLETLHLDVTDPEQIRVAAQRVAATVGDQGLWGLFNNAGITVNSPLECLPIDELRRQFEVNVIGQVAVTQAFLPLLRKARGRILTTGSIAGFFASPALGAYSMSKHAIEAFSDALRRELRPWGIEVSLLEPGAVATEIWRKGTTEIDARMRQPTLGILENYGGLVSGMRKLAERTGRSAAPTEVVTRDVVHAFTASRPRTRYLMGSGATARKWISRLPDRWVDALVARVTGWG
jgi:NAD(P)-dependent dehydrogenase (short-subunit alcohol dehydrogenase family)